MVKIRAEFGSIKPDNLPIQTYFGSLVSVQYFFGYGCSLGTTKILIWFLFKTDPNWWNHKLNQTTSPSRPPPPSLPPSPQNQREGGSVANLVKTKPYQTDLRYHLYCLN